MKANKFSTIYFLIFVLLMASVRAQASYVNLNARPTYFTNASPSATVYDVSGGRITQRASLQIAANQGRYVAIQSVKAITALQLARGALAVVQRHPVITALSAAGLVYVALDDGGEFQQQTGTGTQALDCTDGCYNAVASGSTFYSEDATTAARAALASRELSFTHCVELGGTHNNVRCYGELLDENGEVISTGSNASGYTTGVDHQCGSGQIYSTGQGCIADEWSESQPAYETIPFEQAVSELGSHLESAPNAVETLLNDFTAQPEPEIDQAIYEQGAVETHFEGPAQVSGDMPDGSTWDQNLYYDENGVYISPPVVTTPQGDTYIDYSYEPVVADSAANTGTTEVNVDIDLSGVEQRLDQIIENTAQGECDPKAANYYECLSAPMSQLPEHSTINFQTFEEVNASFKNRLDTAQLTQAFGNFANLINLQSASCPQFAVDLTEQFGPTGNASTDIHCSLMENAAPVLSAVMLVAYTWLAFRIFASA